MPVLETDSLFLDMQDGYKAEIFEWLQTIVIPNLYHTRDYNNRSLTEYSEKFISDGYAMRLGPPRLRQLRVVPGT